MAWEFALRDFDTLEGGNIHSHKGGALGVAEMGGETVRGGPSTWKELIPRAARRRQPSGEWAL